jgi:hypothetical protein
MNVNVYNRCSDFDLEDRRYFSTGVDWNEKQYKNVYAGNMMSVDLMPLLSTFEDLLTYSLEKEDTESIYIRLFVTWKSESYKKFSVLIHLIKYEGQYAWSKSTLEEYYQRYASQLCTYTGPIRDTWLMSDGTVLMTELELDFTQRDGILNIVISEGIKDGHTKKPKWINLKR